MNHNQGVYLPRTPFPIKLIVFRPTATTSASPPPSAHPQPTTTPASVPAQQFKPPHGYVPLSQPSSKPTFSSADLSGKQIWHITAPAALPLISLTSLAADSLQTGATVLTHKEISYTLRPDANPTPHPLHLFLPSTQGSSTTYQSTPHPVTQTLHLQPRLDLPVVSRGAPDPQPGSVAAVPVSTVRPQPRGLRMRYRPPGFGAGNPGRIGSGSEDEEDEDDAAGTAARSYAGGAQWRLPTALKTHGRETEAKGNEPREKKGKKKKKNERDQDAPKGGEGKQETEAKREKAEKERRKEEKRARKESKKMAAEIVEAAKV